MAGMELYIGLREGWRREAFGDYLLPLGVVSALWIDNYNTKTLALCGGEVCNNNLIKMVLFSLQQCLTVCWIVMLLVVRLA